MHSILVYQSISSPDEPMPGEVDVSPEKFEKQLQWLSRRRSVVSLEDALTPRSGMTAITFDDGFRDNLTVALPLLEKFQLPMTLFVTAGFIGRVGYLSGDEVREIAQHPLVTIGAHGLWHRNFTQLSKENARGELVESKRLLEHLTKKKVEFMSWPYSECNARLELLSKECGYRASWSGWKGSNSNHSRQRVPVVRRDNIARFMGKAMGVYVPMKTAEKKLEVFGIRGFLPEMNRQKEVFHS